MLAFEPDAHRYTWNGRPVPGVTEAIRSALGDPFANIAPDVLERKRRLGVAAHVAWQLDDEGTLYEGSVHSAVMPLLEAWRAFRRELRSEIVLIEKRLYHDSLGYAGTLDRLLRINGDRAIVDGKTGLPGPLAALQTAAYAELVDSEFGSDGGEPIRRFSLQTLPSGRYKFEEHRSPADFRDFLACLAVHRLKERMAV